MGQSCSWVFFEVLGSEDLLNFLIEVKVSNLGLVLRVSEVILEHLVLLSGQLYLLGVESSSEFSGINLSFS
jgi:hypothetical protein